MFIDPWGLSDVGAAIVPFAPKGPWAPAPADAIGPREIPPANPPAPAPAPAKGPQQPPLPAPPIEPADAVAAPTFEERLNQIWDPVTIARI